MDLKKFLTVVGVAILAVLPVCASGSTTYLLRLGGARIGTLERTVAGSDSGRMTVRECTRIRMSRGDRSIEMSEDLTWTELEGSGLESFGVERSGFGPDRWSDGFRRAGSGWSWRRSRSRGGPSKIDTVLCGRLSGPVAIDRSFTESPDTVRIRTVDPTTTEPATYVAHFLRADTLVSRDARIACRVYVLRDSSGTSPEVLQWRDGRGEVWKENDPTLGWTSERIELAPGRAGESDLDVMAWISIPLEGKFRGGTDCTLVVERVDGGEPADATPPIPDGVGQRVVPIVPGSVWKVIRRQDTRISPERAMDRTLWRADPELAGALEPGLIVDAGDPSIRAFAERAAAGSDTPAAEALALERAVGNAIRTRDLGTVFGTASQTLRDGRGDCTEHAVLLAACCRARGIPARLVAGIVPNGAQMSFHLWTEVYLGSWIPLDATRGIGSIDPCAVALQRWTQPEDGLAGFQVSLERMTAGYRFRFVEE
jgi:transglutaminase-like putative cysteine protease